MVLNFLVSKAYGTTGWGHLKLVSFWESDPLHGELVVPHDELVHLLVRPFLLLFHVPKPEQPIPLRTVGHSKIVIHSDLFSLRNIIQTLQRSDQPESEEDFWFVRSGHLGCSIKLHSQLGVKEWFAL